MFRLNFSSQNLLVKLLSLLAFHFYQLHFILLLIKKTPLISWILLSH